MAHMLCQRGCHERHLARVYTEEEPYRGLTMVKKGHILFLRFESGPLQGADGPEVHTIPPYS